MDASSDLPDGDPEHDRDLSRCQQAWNVRHTSSVHGIAAFVYFDTLDVN